VGEWSSPWVQVGAATVMELEDASARVAAVGEELEAIEGQLIRLTREGSAGERSLDSVIEELASLVTRLPTAYTTLQECLERRDVTYELVTSVGELHKRVVWLYRRLQLEQVFFSKLRLERTLRDVLYRQILETYDEFSSLEEKEAHLRALSETALASELLKRQDGGEQ